MGRKKLTKILNIYLNNILVGELKKNVSGQIGFTYDQDWIVDGLAISNSMPLSEQEYKGEVVSRYFDNLLPDNDEIKKNVAVKFGAESTRPFDMLEVIGRECVGALSFLPEGFNPSDNFKINSRPISNEEIAKRLNGLSGANPLGMENDDFRISIAGAQEKTAFIKINNQWHEPIGLTPTTHIFKTSIGAMGVNLNFQDSVDNEWFSLYLLKQFGLPTCHADIEIFGGDKVLVVERFDRVWRTLNDQRILLRMPQEDMCQALNTSPYQKYQNEGGPGIVKISQFLNSSKEIEDRFNFFKAILVFDLLYATDGHAKNFSIFLQEDGFKLTPFYDVMSGFFLHKREKMPLEKLKLAMKVGDSGHYAFKRISLKHYQETAKACGFSSDQFDKLYHEVRDTMLKLNINTRELNDNLDLKTTDIILEGMHKRFQTIFK